MNVVFMYWKHRRKSSSSSSSNVPSGGRASGTVSVTAGVHSGAGNSATLAGYQHTPAWHGDKVLQTAGEWSCTVVTGGDSRSSVLSGTWRNSVRALVPTVNADFSSPLMNSIAAFKMKNGDRPYSSMVVTTTITVVTTTITVVSTAEF